MKSQRQLQVGETIKRIIADIFLRGDVITFAGSYITVLEADSSPDMKNVRIFVDIFGNEKEHDKIIEKLNEMVPHFRFLLAKKITGRGVPEITFILDKTSVNALRLENLLEVEAEKMQQGSKKKPRKK